MELVMRSRGRVWSENPAATPVHSVTATAEHLCRYGGEEHPERLLEASFEFLLEREPKESILRSFELPVIERYFPEYTRDIKTRL